VEQVLGLDREKHFDLNVRHFHENYGETPGELKLHLVKLALQGAGQVQRGRKRGVHRKRRTAACAAGMLLHIDGSPPSLGSRMSAGMNLIVILDDASREIYYAQISGRRIDGHGVAGLKRSDPAKGVFCPCTATGRHFWLTPKVAEGPILTA